MHYEFKAVERAPSMLQQINYLCQPTATYLYFTSNMREEQHSKSV